MGRSKGGGIMITPKEHTPEEGYAFGGVLGKVINFIEENEGEFPEDDDWSEELTQLRTFCTDASYIVSGWEEFEELNIEDTIDVLRRLIGVEPRVAIVEVGGEVFYE